MKSLHIFTVAEGRMPCAVYERFVIRTHLCLDWEGVISEHMKEPDTLRAMVRIMYAAAQKAGLAYFDPKYEPPLMAAIRHCYELANGMYSRRDGGPYAVLADSLSLQGLERMLEPYITDYQFWAEAWGLAVDLASLKRHLPI